MRPTVWMIGAGLLAGCTDGLQQCDELIPIWEDLDGDGFGGKQLDDACGIREDDTDKALKGMDCDDSNAEINPKVAEVCDGIDNDCDGQFDNGMELKQWYSDTDGDGFGAQYPSQLACERPGDGWVTKIGDCDDSDAGRNPDAQEVCGGSDEDCDGREGDFDSSVDIGTYQTFYEDNDEDGLGVAGATGRFCRLQPRYSPNTLDCDDTNELIGQFRFYDDADEDTYGDPDTLHLSCTAPAGTVKNNLDCDDSDSAINIDKLWYVDQDLDGFGSQAPIAYQCAPPDEATLDHTDCDDDDSDIHPGVAEVCMDGIDQDCSGGDECPSCLEYLLNDPTLVSGTYPIIPDGVTVRRVFCDMETDGGGWTLVGSSRYPMYDYGIGYYNNLEDLNPTGGSNQALWDGLENIADGNSDIRFACKRPDTEPDMAVDLSFYNIHWYDEIVTGNSDSQVCFNQGNGSNSDPPPARRNNLTDEFLPEGDPWNSGYLIGEESCNDVDFTVDFDDRGADGNENDGTDWGYDDGTYKCGYAGVWPADWFVFVREIP